MFSLFELENRLRHIRHGAEVLESKIRREQECEDHTQAELKHKYDRIEVACQIQNRCDTGLLGISAIVDLVGISALKMDEIE